MSRASAGGASTSGSGTVGLRERLAIHLRWGDLDAYNHVNNVAVIRLLEEARVRAFWAPDRDDDEGHPTAVLDRDGDALSIIAGHRVEYLREISYQHTPLEVQLWVSRLGWASFEIAYEVHSLDGLAVIATSTLVLVDRETGRPRRLTEAERAAWSPYLGDPPAFRRA